ncbi:hypothetical protein [Psychrobacter aestuarii]|uniref:HEAT repeat domain-containing protein n=1 Tax=Psychrobacter aestuarii TaxID=556327 RepID=A0ABN0VP81_9GAMM|nr:hypothetical protein [Psychrobacter aestuarii]
MRQDTANTQPDATDHDNQADALLAARRARMQDASAAIIELAENEPHSSLKCIHKLSVAGGATEKTYSAIHSRIVTDQDAAGAYHLTLIAQSALDLPIDIRQLVDIVIAEGDNHQRLSLLKNLPVPPVAEIQKAIVDSGDTDAARVLEDYLKDNPEGLGSAYMNAKEEQIVPLSDPNAQNTPSA